MSIPFHTLRRGFAALLVSFFAACGGGGSDGGAANNPGTGGGSPLSVSVSANGSAVAAEDEHRGVGGCYPLDLLALLVEPLSYEFMLRALATALIASIVSAVLSCWLVLIGWSLMALSPCFSGWIAGGGAPVA